MAKDKIYTDASIIQIWFVLSLEKKPFYRIVCIFLITHQVLYGYQTFSFDMQVDLVKEGLVIPYRTFHNAKITGSVEIKIGEKEVIIKQKNITRRMMGYCGKLKISQKEMKDIYSDGILEKYER